MKLYRLLRVVCLHVSCLLLRCSEQRSHHGIQIIKGSGTTVIWEIFVWNIFVCKIFALKYYRGSWQPTIFKHTKCTLYTNIRAFNYRGLPVPRKYFIDRHFPKYGTCTQHPLLQWKLVIKQLSPLYDNNNNSYYCYSYNKHPLGNINITTLILVFPVPKITTN